MRKGAAAAAEATHVMLQSTLPSLPSLCIHNAGFAWEADLE